MKIDRQGQAFVDGPKKKREKFNIFTILKEIIEFKGWEIIFQLFFFAFIAYGIYSLYIVYQFHHDPNFASVPKFSIYDFKMAIIPTFIFFLYKHICVKAFYNFTKTRLHPERFKTEEERHERALKGSIWVSHILYYSFSTILAFFFFKDSFFFPTILGGSGQCSDIYKYSPFVPHIPYAVLFYQIQFGWHFHNLIDHIVSKWGEAKFWEMFLHHSVAVFLIFFSYLSNQVAVGILVLFTHDPSDIGLCACRYYNDWAKVNKPLIFSIYGLFMLSWVFLRLFVFPKCIVGQAFISLYNYPKDAMYPVYVYMILMMTVLVILHIYWFTIVVKILLGALSRNKKDPNTYDKRK